ncbi:SlyX family protein [Conchiformibius kuhniae]|uniref:Protein SlyX homolog n=1 Tax=Conchiformibius kuhniae TaxID=211502 RepID=A0A8T9MT89_9NEIS|nr:SlyX family protein [Conchiformibius kuhniae]UOP04489.1 SlyX family protein [Conchiformibius kuhniae]
MTLHETTILEARLVELEIRTALQDELLATLNDTVAQMRDTLELQQAQLRLLYRRVEQQNDNGAPAAVAEIPPHY